MNSLAEFRFNRTNNHFLLRLCHLNWKEINAFQKLSNRHPHSSVIVMNYASQDSAGIIIRGYDIRTSSQERAEEYLRLIENFCLSFFIPMKRFYLPEFRY